MNNCPERRPPPLVAPRRTSHPSFSASLLDAIYRSLDGDTPELERAATRHSKPRPQPDLLSHKKKSQSDFWWASAKRKIATPSYTSSNASSYGFSSDAELPKAKSTKVNRVQFHSPPIWPPRTPSQEKKKSNPFHKRWRELRKGRPCANSSSIDASVRTSSPLSNFLKAIFSSSRTQKKKKNIMGMAAPQQEGIVAVPVLVPAPPQEEIEDVDMDMEAEAVKRRVEEILRGLEKDKEGAEEEDESDSSSDLFELENLMEIGTDELPVYCTTSLVANDRTVCYK
jgi:hypothetical protein